MVDSAVTPGRGKGAGFFAVHRRSWARICDTGSINEAAAYLVLAQGTGPG
jgi:hypothetical protein